MAHTFTLEAYRHHYAHGGFSYRPTAETADQGRIRCAIEMARAEHILRESSAYVEWRPSEYPDTSWLDQPDFAEHKAEHARGEFVLMDCAVYFDGEIVASLCDIDMRADWQNDPYRRVVEAELASEAGLCHALDRDLNRTYRVPMVKS